MTNLDDATNTEKLEFVRNLFHNPDRIDIEPGKDVNTTFLNHLFNNNNND